MSRKITKKDYVLLFRGGANPEDMTPEQMQTTMNNWMTWMHELRKRNQLTLGHPLEDGGKVLSGAKGKNVKAFKDHKVEVVTLTSAEYDAWINIAKQSSYAEFAKEVPDGKQLIDDALSVK